MFIHDALCDHISCGDTSVPAHELKATIATLRRVDRDTKKTGFQEQFTVSNADAMDSFNAICCMSSIFNKSVNEIIGARESE